MGGWVIGPSRHGLAQSEDMVRAWVACSNIWHSSDINDITPCARVDHALQAQETDGRASALQERVAGM